MARRAGGGCHRRSASSPGAAAGARRPPPESWPRSFCWSAPLRLKRRMVGMSRLEHGAAMDGQRRSGTVRRPWRRDQRAPSHAGQGRRRTTCRRRCHPHPPVIAARPPRPLPRHAQSQRNLCSRHGPRRAAGSVACTPGRARSAALGAATQTVEHPINRLPESAQRANFPSAILPSTLYRRPHHE